MLLNKQSSIAKNTLFLYVRISIVMLISLYISRVLLKQLGIQDYGLYNLVGGVVVLFSSLRALFASTTQRFLSYEMGKGSQNLQKIFSISVMIHIIICIIFLLILETLGLWLLNFKLNIPVDRVSAANWVFQLSVVSTLITIMTTPFDALLIANERMKIYALFSIIEFTFKLIAVFILPLVIADKLILYAVMIGFIGLLIRGMNSLYCRLNFSESKIIFSWDLSLFKEMGTFAGWQFLGTTAFSLTNEGLNMLLNIFFGPGINAARALAYQVRGALMQLISNLMLSVSPQLIKLHSMNENKAMFYLFNKISKGGFYFVFAISLPFLFYTKELLQLWLGQIPPYTIPFVRYNIIFLIIRSLHSPLDILLKAVNRIKIYQLTTSIVSICNLPIAYMFLRYDYSPNIVFILMCLIEVINTSIITFLVVRYTELSFQIYFREVLLNCFAISVISLCFSFFIYSSFHVKNIYYLSYTILLITLLNFTNIWFVGLNKTEKMLILKKLRLVS